MNIRKKYYIISILSLFLIFILLGFLFLHHDAPEKASSSRALWIDEALKNYICKNIIQLDEPQPYENNEFRASWLTNPVYTFWCYPFVRIFGVGYTQVRLLSLITALVTALLLVKLLSIEIDYSQILLFILLLLMNFSFLIYSRVGTYESFFLLLVLLVILILYQHPKSTSGIIIVTLFLTVLYWLKATGIIVAVMCLLTIFTCWFLDGKKKSDLKIPVIFIASYAFFMILLSFILKHSIKTLPRSLSIDGSVDILHDKFIPDLYSFLWNLGTMFDTPRFMQLNYFIFILAFLGLGLCFLNGVKLRRIDVFMFYWLLIGLLSVGWATYRIGRLFYIILPPMAYWAAYSLFNIRSILFKLRAFKVTFVTCVSMGFISVACALLLRGILLGLHHFGVQNDFLLRIAFSPYKVVFFFISLLTTFSFIKTRLLQLKTIIFVCLIMLLISSMLQQTVYLIHWHQSDEQTIRSANVKMKEILTENRESMVAGQWSPAFVFNIKGIQSYPIIPSVYNENILDQRDIRYLFIERGEHGHERFFRDRYGDKLNNAKVLKSFFVANKWWIDLYDFKPD